jgi:Asp/Glu/hydantoin racemase
MVTCSSLGNAVEWCRSFIDIPIYRVDEPMAEKAVHLGRRIGVAATLQTTLSPTLELIQAKAAQSGEQKQVISKLCVGAFEALAAGDTSRHDQIILEGLQDLISQVDVIVLAQASMARVAGALPQKPGTPPIISSPRLAVEQLASLINGPSPYSPS